MSKKRNTGWHDTGMKIPVPREALDGSRLDRTIAALRPGQHLWVSMTAHRVHPDRMETPGEITFLDGENLLQTGLIGCYVCEQPWVMAGRNECPGEPQDGADHG